MSSRPRLLSSTPLLVVADLQRSIDFYCAKLGFGEPSVWGEPPCFGMLHRDGFEIMLSLTEGETRPRPNGPHGTWDIYLRTSDLGAETAALAAAGLALAKGPTDTFYDMREIEVCDPDGYRICFGMDLSRDSSVANESWAGVLDMGSAKLRLVLKLAQDPLRGWLDSPDQRTLNVILDSITRDGTALRFELNSFRATFVGTTSADGTMIEGQWTQSGHTWPLCLRRG